MDRGVRVHRRLLSTPVWYYQAQGGRAIIVVGTYPYGDLAYYAAVRSVLYDAEQGGAQVHYEQSLRHRPDDAGRPHADEARVIQSLERVTRFQETRAAMLGWSVLDEALQPGDAWHAHEQRCLTLIRCTGTAWLQERVNGAVQLLDRATNSRRGPADFQLAIARTALMRARQPNRFDHHTALYWRAQQAISAIDGSTGDVAVAWEAPVLPHIAVTLHRRPGVERQRADWLTVGRLPRRSTAYVHRLLGILGRNPVDGPKAGQQPASPPQ